MRIQLIARNPITSPQKPRRRGGCAGCFEVGSGGMPSTRHGAGRAGWSPVRPRTRSQRVGGRPVPRPVSAWTSGSEGTAAPPLVGPRGRAQRPAAGAASDQGKSLVLWRSSSGRAAGEGRDAGVGVRALGRGLLRAERRAPVLRGERSPHEREPALGHLRVERTGGGAQRGGEIPG